MLLNRFYLTLLLHIVVYTTVNNVALSFSNQTSIVVYQNGHLSQLFNSSDTALNCVEPQTYILQQTTQQLKSNTLYNLSISTDSNVNISLTTQYGRFTPTLQSQNCSGTCQISIWNNCPQPITQLNYFDILTLKISGVPDASYRVWCNQDYRPNTFQWGLFIIIVVVTILISVTAIYSRAWSFGGQGIQINYWMIGVLALLWIAGGLMGAFIPTPTYVIVLILSWILGVICIGICSNECLWLLRNNKLNKPLMWKIRGIDIISFVVGIGIMLSWWLTNMNWISSNLIGGCVIIAFIKCFKFTSMKIALIMLMIILMIEVVGALIINYVVGQSYNVIILNNFDNPMFLQLPTIKTLLNQKCSWLPVTQIIFPGIFLSYLRRFDDSRNTRVYLIVACTAFCIGSMGWMIMTIFNIHSWPFALFSETLLFIMVTLFAINRNEIRIIWNGKFYDQEFADISETKKLKESFAGNPEIQLRESIFNALRISNNTQSKRQSQISQPIEH